MSLTILRKVVWVGAGVATFLAASVGISLLSMVVSALVPGASPDREGRLEPSPEETAKAEWLRQNGASQETQPSTQSTETANKPSEPEPQPEEPQPAPQPQEPESPQLLSMTRSWVKVTGFLLRQCSPRGDQRWAFIRIRVGANSTESPGLVAA
jgi:outer membrane biosynthesis protein TonB